MSRAGSGQFFSDPDRVGSKNFGSGSGRVRGVLKNFRVGSGRVKNFWIRIGSGQKFLVQDRVGAEVS